MRASFARGDLATWGYGEGYAAAASDPSAILPGAARVLCLAMPYATRRPEREPPLTGRVSNYAWSRDYHTVLRGKLGELAGMLDDFAGAKVAIAVCDTAPLAERA